MVVRSPQYPSCCFRICRLVALSSTTSTRRPASRAGGTGTAVASGACRSKRTVNQKVLPRPGRLSTSIAPPMSETSRFEMARPSPVPP